MQIGFVGLGRMGVAMVGTLLKAGQSVTVWNRSAGPADALRAQGASVAPSATAAFDADVVILMLADDTSTREVVGTALAGARAGAVHVNMATTSVAFGKEMQALYAARGLQYVSAPVFGRPDAAAASALAIVAAGPEAALDRVQPLFDIMGRRTWRVGAEPHLANVVKIAGNFMLASTIEAMGEASALVEGYGVPGRELMDVMTNTLFSSPAFKGYGALIGEERYQPAGFHMVLGLKDVRLALAASEAAHVPLPLAGIVRDNLLDGLAHGMADHDWAALAEVARRRAGKGQTPGGA